MPQPSPTGRRRLSVVEAWTEGLAQFPTRSGKLTKPKAAYIVSLSCGHTSVLPRTEKMKETFERKLMHCKHCVEARVALREARENTLKGGER